MRATSPKTAAQASCPSFSLPPTGSIRPKRSHPCSICRPSACYSRFANPTCDAVEKKIAGAGGRRGRDVHQLRPGGEPACHPQPLLRGGPASSRLPRSMAARSTCSRVTLKKLGIECIWADAEADAKEIQKAVQAPTPRLLFGETHRQSGASTVFDIQKWARYRAQKRRAANHGQYVCHAHPVPSRSNGARISSSHSTTKYMDGHAVQVRRRHRGRRPVRLGRLRQIPRAVHRAGRELSRRCLYP